MFVTAKYLTTLQPFSLLTFSIVCVCICACSAATSLKNVQCTIDKPKPNNLSAFKLSVLNKRKKIRLFHRNVLFPKVATLRRSLSFIWSLQMRMSA